MDNTGLGDGPLSGKDADTSIPPAVTTVDCIPQTVSPRKRIAVEQLLIGLSGHSRVERKEGVWVRMKVPEWVVCRQHQANPITVGFPVQPLSPPL